MEVQGIWGTLYRIEVHIYEVKVQGNLRNYQINF